MPPSYLGKLPVLVVDHPDHPLQGGADTCGADYRTGGL
jgi:hypothetical protein